MRPRFYAPDLTATSDRVALPADEAEHLLRVLRLGTGAEVSVLDGRGGLWRAEVVQAGKKTAMVRPIEREAPAPESRVPMMLVSSVLKSEKMDEVVRDAVMLGVMAIQTVVSERSEISLSTLIRGKRAERWRRIAVASTKQCGRAVLASVMDPIPFEEYLEQKPLGMRLMCVEPSAEPGDAHPVGEVSRPAAADVIVGPEGGWSLAEVEMAVRAGVTMVSLGKRTLRADAVPTIALAAFLTTWGEL